MNNLVIDGRLVANPQLRKTANNTSVLSFRIAHNTKDRTTFLTCEAWGTGAEVIADRFRKGDPINLSGYIRQDEWTGKDGEKRSMIVMRVEWHSRPLGSGSAVSSRAEANGEPVDTDKDYVHVADSRHEEDDIPF